MSTPATSDFNLRALFRFSALGKLAEVPRAKLRSLRFSAWALSLSGVVSVLLVAKVGAPDVADLFALRIVAYAAFLYGGYGLWTLLSKDALNENCFGLARLRGWNEDGGAVRLSTLARHLIVGMCIAGLPGIVASLFVTNSDPTRTSRAVLVLGTAAYLFLLGSTLALVAGVARHWFPRHTRAATMMMLLLPFLLSLNWSWFPNFISLFVWGYEQLTFIGVLVS